MIDIVVSMAFTSVIFASSAMTSDWSRKRLMRKAWERALKQTSQEALSEQQKWSKATEWVMKATNPAYYVVGLILVASFFIAILRGAQGVLFTHPAMLAGNSVMALLLVMRAYHLRRLDAAMVTIHRHAESMDDHAGRLYLQQIHIPKEIYHERLDR